MNLLTYLRIPYRLGGRRSDGVDCYGLVRVYYYIEFGIELPDFDFDESGFNKSPSYIMERFESAGFEITESCNPGTVIVLYRAGAPRHLGVLVDKENFLHTTKAGTAVHSYVSGQWGGKVVCKLKHKDL